MAQYDIGGGKKIQIPDNLDPETRLQLAEAVKDEYGIDINQTSALEQSVEFGKGIIRGGLGLALDVPTGIVGLFDIGNDSAAYKGLEGLQDKLRQESPLAADPRYADKFSTKLGEGIGSFGPFLGAGLVGRALTKTPGAAKGLLSPTFTAPAALAVPTGIAAQGDRLQMAREMGEDVGGLAETTAELFGGVIGLTEVLPIANILGKVHKNAPLSAKEKLVSALQSGAAEGGQEVAASILQDLTARGLYSDELPIGESMFEEFTIGGIIGGAADLVVSSMAGKKAVRDKQMEEEGLRAEEKKEQLILAKKAELAQEQGTLDVVQDTQVVTVPQIPAPKEVAVEPQVEIIETPDNKFSLIDISNPDSPVVLDTKDKQTDASIAKQKLLDTFDVAQLKDTLDNDTYNLGMVNSSTAYEIGQSVLDTKAANVNIQQLINTVPDKSKTEKKLKKIVEDYTQQTGRPMSSMPRINMKEAKDLLTTKEFNDFTSAYAKKTFQVSEKKGEPSIIADKQQPDTSVKYVKDIAASKNIDLDFNSPAVQYAAEQYTGTADYKKMNKGQKELFLAKLHSLPKFNSRTTFPDFKPRDYSAQETADFVAEMKSNNSTFTRKDLSMIGKNDQFLEDLLYSGRAEQVEGTRSYKIRDNFEFDIARRAEGFNETPQEFGARLTAQASENKLTPEGIAELVAAEETRQERLLPPAEVIPKTINYAETLEEGKTNKLAKEIRKIMDARGLKDTGIVVSNDILSTTTLKQVEDKIVYDPRQVQATETEGAVQGEYDRNTDTIFLSLNAVNPDGNATDIEIQQRLNKVLDHEMVHALRAKDLITKSEYSYLTKMVKKTKFPNQNQTFYKEAEQRTTQDRLGKPAALQEELIVEEAIAEYFANKDLLVNTPKKVEGIFNKIIEFFKSMGQAMRTSGYKNSQEIFNDIESGKIGSRTRDEIRTTRLGDKERTMFLDRIPQDEPVPPRTEVPGEEIVSTLKPRGIRPLTIPKPKPTPPTTPTTPVAPSTPTTIYNRDKLTDEEYKAERDNILKGLQDAKVLDKAIFDKDGNVTKTIKGNYDSVKMMKWLVDNSPSQDYKIIAQKVYKSLLALKKQRRTFPLQLEVGKKVINSRALGQVSPRKPTDIFQTLNFSEFTMSINDSNRNILMDESKWRRGNGVNFETLLHEGIHQATLAQIYAVRENTTTRVADSGTMAIATDKKGLKVKAAYKELSTQAKRIQKYYRDRMKFYDKLSDKIETPEGLKEYNAIYNNAPVIEKEIADIYINTDSTGFKFKRSEGFGYGMELGQTELRQAFNQYRIRYQLFSNEVQANEDVSELLTFGLTNRDFQEMLEYIPLGKDATGSVWNKFVETIRKLLEIPAKLNTELSAFLKNASTALDLKAEGIQAPFVPASEREVSQDIPTFSRESDDAYFAREKKNQKISNLESSIYFKESQLNQERGSMTDATARRLEREIAQQKNQIAELTAGDLPTFSRGQRFNDGTNSQKNIKLADALAEAEETVKQTPRGAIPFYNLNASDMALEIALEFNKDLSATTPEDIPTFSRPGYDGIDSDIAEASERLGGKYQPDRSWGARTIEAVKDPVTSINSFFKDFRQNFIDKLDKVDKKIMQASQDSEEVRYFNNTADTATMAALRLADRARGLFQGMLTRGYVSDVIEGNSALANVKDLELQNGETGGLIQILAPLFSNPEVNLEKVFKLYATLKRAESFDAQGKLVETPVKAEDYALIQRIEQQHPEVLKVYNNYQTWNNKLIDFAEKKGLLDPEQAEMWRQHSSYYPFYRNMVDDAGISAPTIAEERFVRPRTSRDVETTFFILSFL